MNMSIDENTVCEEYILAHQKPKSSPNIEETYGDRSELRSLLKEWNMEDLGDFFIEQQLYVGVLRHLDKEMAKNLLSKSNFSLGIQIEFFYNWSKWKINTENQVKETSHPSVSKCAQNGLNLLEILNSNPYGLSVLKSYKENNSLNDNTRKLLCEAITHFCIEKEHSLTVKDSENLSQQIVKSFTGEEMAYYHVNRPNAAPLGKLYNKYRNLKSLLSKKTKSAECPTNIPTLLPEEEEGHLRILKHEFNALSYEDILKHWNGCFGYRQKSLKDYCVPNSKKQILDLWPMFKSPIGFRLIDNDFNRTFGEINKMLDNFDNFSDLMIHNLFPKFESKFKDEDDLKIWRYIKENNCIDYNCKHIIVLTLLQSLLPQSRIKSKVPQKGSKFYSAMESKRAFINFAPTEEAYKEYLDRKIATEASIPPFVTIIGDIYKPQAFFCDFDNIKYKLFSITKAIDICFKAYHLFNIKYPEASNHIWDFINLFFYKIDTTTIISPAIHMLCKNIEDIQD